MEQRSKVRGLCAFTYSASMYSRIQDIREWRRVEIGSQETEVASVMSTQFMEDTLPPYAPNGQGRQEDGG